MQRLLGSFRCYGPAPVVPVFSLIRSRALFVYSSHDIANPPYGRARKSTFRCEPPVYNRQSIGDVPERVRASFIFEKGLPPKNPVEALRGDGWADLMIVCRVESISFSFFCA